MLPAAICPHRALLALNKTLSLSRSSPLRNHNHIGLHRNPTANISFLRRFFASGVMSAAARTKAQGIINENAVAVFSKSYCPYCRETKQLLTEKGASFYVIELDQIDDGAAIQDALEEMTSQRSVPNIFIKQQHIGGNSDLKAKKGQLDGLLKDAGAI